MTSVSINVYIDKLDDILNKYNNTYHSTIKTKRIDIKPSAYIDTSKDINYDDPKFKISDIVRIPKYKNIFAKGYVPNWSEEVCVIKKVKDTVPWTYIIIRNFWNVLQKRIAKNKSKEFRVEEVIKRKGDKLYVKWKGYDSYFNSWIGKKDTV